MKSKKLIAHYYLAKNCMQWRETLKFWQMKIELQ